MSGGDLPAPIRAFIAENIRTVVELEALLLMHANADREWSAQELGRELRIDEQFARQELLDLMQRGLAACAVQASGCHYAPRTPELNQTVNELAEIYAQRRVSVIQTIYARPSDPIQSFADAFRFRKGKPNG